MLFARLTAARAAAEVTWAGAARANIFAEALRTKAESIARQTIGVGRGKSVGPS